MGGRGLAWRLDLAWKNRPEWARPAVGGVALGLVLLGLPQLYGVGYPVMYKAVAGDYVLWFLLVLAAGKMVACSLTLGIGGSGGVFAPSLFVGVTSGMAFGEIAGHILGPGAGQPALYAVVAMGAVFTSAARAPLTSVASVVEMTGDYALTLPVMLAVAIATATSRALSYGTIYTTKLLRRGYDVDRAAPWRAFGDLTAAGTMRPFPAPLAAAGGRDGQASHTRGAGGSGPALPVPLPGAVTFRGDPQAVYAGESLTQTLGQLAVYGRDGLPVLTGDGQQVQGWITNDSVLQAIAREIGTAPPQAGRPGAQAASAARPGQATKPPTPLPGYQVLEITIGPGSPAAGKTLGALSWPPGWIPVSLLHHRSLQEPNPDRILEPGDQISLLAPHANREPSRSPGHEAAADPAAEPPATDRPVPVPGEGP